jgi:uncharacterized protein (DUF1015 family)
MADVQPFRALRYGAAADGPLERLVAPPYDVISPDQRQELAGRSPHNVVRLTLPESEDEAARLLADWQAGGVLVEEPPAVWALTQDYVGPDGVARTRRGILASLRVEPYERGIVLPHERTHAGPKEGRLRLLRATGVQLEPIFLLYDGEPPPETPERQPDLEAEGARLWRIEDAAAVTEAFADRQLLIADGHHRYETALAYAAERGTPEAARLPVVLVSTDDPGLEIFPTHRVFAGPITLPVVGGGTPEVEDALAALEGGTNGRAAAVVYRDGLARLLFGAEGQLDVQLVDSLGQEGISYTPDWREAVACVDAGDATAAVLLRPTRIEDVFAVARRGEVLPQKSTYFFPKLLSGLLFHPVA